MNTGSDTGKLLGAIVVGAVAGAILGVLFAPDKGSETRRKLFKKAKDLTDDVTNKVKENISNFKTEAEVVKDNIEAEWDHVKETTKQASGYSAANKRPANGNASKKNHDY